MPKWLSSKSYLPDRMVSLNLIRIQLLGSDKDYKDRFNVSISLCDLAKIKIFEENNVEAIIFNCGSHFIIGFSI